MEDIISGNNVKGTTSDLYHTLESCNGHSISNINANLEPKSVAPNKAASSADETNNIYLLARPIDDEYSDESVIKRLECCYIVYTSHIMFVSLLPFQYFMKSEESNPTFMVKF